MKKRITFLFAAIILIVSAFVLSCSNDDDKCTKPSAPSGVSALAQSTNSIKISWGSVSGKVNSYNIYRASSSDGNYSIVKTVESVTPYTDAELSPGTHYYYKISAENDCGESEMSNVVSDVTLDCKPDAPASVSAEALSSTSIKIEWGAVNTATSYKVYRAISQGGGFYIVGGVVIGGGSGVGEYSLVETVESGTSFTDEELSATTTYYYKISAVNTCGEGEQSDSKSATTLDCPKPAAPTNVFAETISPTSVEISWDEVNTAVGYKIYRSTSANGFYTSVGNTDGKENTSYIDEELQTATDYYYKVSAISDCGAEGLQSVYDFVSTDCNFVPSPPTDFTVEALSSTQIKITITGSSSGASRYVVYLSENGANGTYRRSVTYNAYYTTFTISAMDPSTTYWVRIAVENSCGTESARSTAVVTVTTAPCNLAAPSYPTGVTASALSSRSVKISWNAANGATTYDVYRRSSTDAGTSYWTVPGGRGLTATTFTDTDTNLLGSTTYSYAVHPINSCGGKPEYLGSTTIVSVTTLCRTSAPTNVEISDASSNSIDISWNAVSGATTYSVYRASTLNGTYTLVDTTPNNSFTDDNDGEGLQSLRNYFYKITAKTASCDESDKSDYVMGATTQAE
ncbi:MAG: fibronectin type III domain-containing protein [Chitinivibrionia bacterium]|nr:fibronectin type III domain-containing protein [Chitinivibrionia bacterium]